MNKYIKEQIENLNEKRSFLLSLRKRKLNKKIIENRSNYSNINAVKSKNEEKLKNLEKEEKNNSFIKFIKCKFNELCSNKNKEEKIYTNILNEIMEYLSDNFQRIELNKVSESLIESQTLENIFNDLIIKKYINNTEIINLILIIYSCILFIYNHFINSEELKSIFISNQKYINLYLSLFKFEDEEIIYNSYKFLGILSHNSNEIKRKLLDNNILEKIINNNMYNNKIEIIEVKLWCIAQFDIIRNYDEKTNINIYLQIQIFYINIFDNYLNKGNYNIELLKNFLNVLNNLSLLKNEQYINNLLNSKIMNFLLEENINKNLPKEKLLTLIGNMNSFENPKISLEIYKLAIQFLINIIFDINTNVEIVNLSLWCINNFTSDKDLCLDIFFGKNLLSLYKNYIIKNEKIDENIFIEICIGYTNLLHKVDKNKIIILIKEYNIMSLIIQGFKKIEKINKIIRLGENVIGIIFILLTICNEELVNYNRFIFDSKGGNEYIFEKINFIILERKNLKDKKLEQRQYNILEFINYIKKKLLDFECY